MKKLSDVEFIPVAGMIGAILWFMFIPCHSFWLDIMIYYMGGSALIFVPFMVFIFKKKIMRSVNKTWH